jgi:hypothetical protein
MRRQLQSSYTFTPGASGVGTIKFLDYDFIDQKKILGITNATRNVVIYNPNSIGMGGTVANNVLTLVFNTTGYATADQLIIGYENGETKTGVLNNAISQVSHINVTNGGTTIYTSVPTVTISGGTGTQATATAILSNGTTGWVLGVRIDTVGSYTVAPTTVTFTLGGGAGAAATVVSGQYTRQLIDGEGTATLQFFGTYVATNTFEASIDGYNFIPINGINLTTGAIIANATTNITAQIEVSGFKYIQTRLSAYTSGVVLANIKLSATTSAISLDNSLPSGGNTIGGITALVAQTAGVGFALQSNSVVDIASAALTLTGTSATIIQGNTQSAQFNIIVTAVSGTTPTLDISIEESDDTAVNWYPVYQMPRITVAGAYRTPVLNLTGNRIRYVQTVAGTTPSFTRAINRNNYAYKANNLRNFIDRTIVLTTLNSTTPTYYVEGCNTHTLSLLLGTTTTPPAIQLEGSSDGISFYSMGSPVTGITNGGVQVSVSGILPRFIRGRVSTVGATVTANYLEIKSIGN